MPCNGFSHWRADRIHSASEEYSLDFCGVAARSSVSLSMQRSDECEQAARGIGNQTSLKSEPFDQQFRRLIVHEAALYQWLQFAKGRPSGSLHSQLSQIEIIFHHAAEWREQENMRRRVCRHPRGCRSRACCR